MAEIFLNLTSVHSPVECGTTLEWLTGCRLVAAALKTLELPETVIGADRHRVGRCIAGPGFGSHDGDAASSAAAHTLAGGYCLLMRAPKRKSDGAQPAGSLSSTAFEKALAGP